MQLTKKFSIIHKRYLLRSLVLVMTPSQVIFSGIFYFEGTRNLWNKSNVCFHIAIVLANTPQNLNHVGQTSFSDYDLINQIKLIYKTVQISNSLKMMKYPLDCFFFFIIKL